MGLDASQTQCKANGLWKVTEEQRSWQGKGQLYGAYPVIDFHLFNCLSWDSCFSVINSKNKAKSLDVPIGCFSPSSDAHVVVLSTRVMLQSIASCHSDKYFSVSQLFSARGWWLCF